MEGEVNSVCILKWRNLTRLINFMNCHHFLYVGFALMADSGDITCS